MKKYIFAFGLLLSAQVNAANLIVNGSFESQANSEGAATLFTDANPLLGWARASGSGNPYVETRNNFRGVASDGQNFAELDVVNFGEAGFETGLGGMFQTVTINTAGLYDFSFDYAARVLVGNEINTSSLQFSLLDSSNAVVLNEILNPVTPNVAASDWVTYTNQFNLQSGNYTFQFKELGVQDGRGTSLDNVVLLAAQTTTAVPEPETYGMMMLGLVMLGFAARRRKV